MNVLTKPIFSVADSHVLTLPGVLSRLSQRKRTEFFALRPHQQHAWYAFLVQLGVLCNASARAYSEEEWRSFLLDLTDGDSDPWTLIVDNTAKAALLQPPVPERLIVGWNSYTTPDGIDVLVTAKNHDLKMASIHSPAPEHWVYALVTRQTMQGVFGRGHYGIARMNSGLGSRCCITLAPSERWEDRFLRDIQVWKTQRIAGPIKLVWLEPWDGKESIPWSRVDSACIEICARIRMADLNDARITSVSGCRIDAKALKGDTREIWTSIRAEDRAALSVSAKGFDFESFSEVLFSDKWIQPAAQLSEIDRGENPVIIGQVLARSQGKTEGYHRRVIRVSPAMTKEAWPEINRRIEVAQDFKLRILKPAILSLLQGGPDSLKFDDSRAEPWLARFRGKIDRGFFEESTTSWESFVYEAARETFEKAQYSVPASSMRRYRALAQAERLFRGAIARLFPDLPGREESATSDHDLRRRSVISMIAATLQYQTSAADLATLRRIDSLECRPFQILMQRYVGRDVSDDFVDGRWVVVIRAMAQLAGLHRPLFRIGKTFTEIGVPEIILLTLLNSKGEDLHREVRRLSRRLSIQSRAFDQFDLAELIISDGVDPVRSETIRLKIAKDYYRGE